MRALYLRYEHIIKKSFEADAGHMAWRQQIKNLMRKVQHLVDELITIKAEVSRFNTLQNGDGWVAESFNNQFLLPKSYNSNTNDNLCSTHLLRSNGHFQPLDQFMASLE